MCTEIYYFSGTGNSLHVAEELEKRIPCTKLIPIVTLLDNNIIKSKTKTVGFVFPVHSLTILIAVKKFLKKIDLTSAEYIFAVATRYGSVFKGFEKIDQLLKKKNKHLDSHFILNMGHNEAPRQKGYKVPSESDIILIEKVVLDKLDLIKDVISTKCISREKDTDYLVDTSSNPIFSYLIENTVIFAMNILVE